MIDSATLLSVTDYSTASSTVMSGNYTTYATVKGISDGGKVLTEWAVVVANGSSGADRLFSARILCDGVVVGETTDLFVAQANNRRYPFCFKYTHTPTAGEHTWTLQLTASVASAVIMSNPSITVRRTL